MTLSFVITVAMAVVALSSVYIARQDRRRLRAMAEMHKALLQTHLEVIQGVSLITFKADALIAELEKGTPEGEIPGQDDPTWMNGYGVGASNAANALSKIFEEVEEEMMKRQQQEVTEDE